MIEKLGAFVCGARVPAAARERAVVALVDTVGVALAGAAEPVGRIVQQVIAAEGSGCARVLGCAISASAGGAALANGTAAHALDFDDMCFVSLAHPSAPLVAAALAAADSRGASGAAVLDAYVVGFEIEARLGRTMNPRHYQRGWHCTSTLGTIGAAAAASRVLQLDANAAGRALAIAASEASGLKENFGTMVKPLHAGLAARNGVLAALLAERGLTASALAIEGPQGFLAAMDSERPGLAVEIADLGSRWEIEDTGITVKLYPSCAATHPPLDAILDLRRRERIRAADVARVEIDVDSITPTVLIHERPATGLEAKFSMPFCAAAAIVAGGVGIDAFEESRLRDPEIGAMMPRVAMRIDRAFDDGGPALTRARVTIELADGRRLTQNANGARGYPDRPASRDELDAKFLGCAGRTLGGDAATRALAFLRRIDDLPDVRAITAACSLTGRVPASTP